MLSVRPIVLFLTEVNIAFIKQRVTVYKETRLGIPANKREPNSNTKQFGHRKKIFKFSLFLAHKGPFIFVKLKESAI
jgi:hypothetical protein